MRHLLPNIQAWNPATHPILSVTGPTGSGKTSLVLDFLARTPAHARFGAPLLVSVDAVSAYRELNIGSAKPRGPEREQHPWVGLDLVSPNQKISVEIYESAVTPPLLDALNAQRPVILVGGSHFYERALVQGRPPGAATDPAFLISLRELSSDQLHAQLTQSDPRWAARVHPHDRYRLERYSDLHLRQSLSYDQLFSPQHSGLAARFSVATVLVGLDHNARVYQDALRTRIASMLKEGWEDETRQIAARYGFPAPALQSIGYKQIADTLAGQAPADTMLERILIAHRQLGKKQRTWLRTQLHGRA